MLYIFIHLFRLCWHDVCNMCAIVDTLTIIASILQHSPTQRVGWLWLLRFICALIVQ